jgi:hypothetical protein
MSKNSVLPKNPTVNDDEYGQSNTINHPKATINGDATSTTRGRRCGATAARWKSRALSPGSLRKAA